MTKTYFLKKANPTLMKNFAEKIKAKAKYYSTIKEMLPYADCVVCVQSAERPNSFVWMLGKITKEYHREQFGKTAKVAELIILGGELLREEKTEHIDSFCSHNCYVKIEDGYNRALNWVSRDSWDYDRLKESLDEIRGVFEKNKETK